MSFNLEKYIKGSAKDAFSRMSEDASNQLRDAAINSVTKTFGGALKKIGFSNKIVSSLTSKMADAAQAELAERFFRKANPEINRIPAANGEGVRQNRVKGAQETVNQFQQAIGQGYGTSTSSYPTERGYYYCQLTFYNYSRPNAHDNGTLEPKSVIYLPLPGGSNLVERQSLKLTNTDLGVGGAVGDLFARGEMSTSDLAGAATPAVERVISKLGNAAIDGAGDALKNFAQQAFAYAPNPHTSVMFQGVNLRTHQFNWRLSPETPTESVKAAEIARLIRFYSLPVFFNDTTALFSYPMICKVKFFAGDGEHPYLKNFTKYCMVQEVNINYAPNGVPSFFAGTDAPTSIELGIQLQEIEYFTAESYGTQKEMIDLGRDRSVLELNPVADVFSAGDESDTTPAVQQETKDPIYGPWTIDEIGEWQLSKGSRTGFLDSNVIVKPNPDGTRTQVNLGVVATGGRGKLIKLAGDVTAEIPAGTYYAEIKTLDASGKHISTKYLFDSSGRYKNSSVDGKTNFQNALISENLVVASRPN